MEYLTLRADHDVFISWFQWYMIIGWGWWWWWGWWWKHKEMKIQNYDNAKTWIDNHEQKETMKLWTY
jgi:hypothetical protein